MDLKDPLKRGGSSLHGKVRAYGNADKNDPEEREDRVQVMGNSRWSDAIGGAGWDRLSAHVAHTFFAEEDSEYING